MIWVGLLLCALALTSVLGALLDRVSSSRKRRLMNDIAEALSLQLQLHDRQWSAYGLLEQFGVSVRFAPGGGLRVRVVHFSSSSLSVHPAVHAPFGRDEARLETGDRSFDRLIALSGAEPAQLVAWLDAPTRKLLREWMWHGLRCARGVWTLDAQEDLRAALEAVHGALHVARSYQDARGAVDASLQRQAAGDPEPEVRLRACALAIARGAPDAWLAHMSDDPDPAVAFSAAIARGEAGREQIARLLGSRDRAIARVTAQRLAEIESWRGERALEARLIELLAEAPERTIADLLGEIGTLRALPALRRAAVRGYGLASAAAAARRAIARICARMGVEGTLALAEPSARGRLSPAEHRSTPE